jgi:Uma2 family endonuclease
MSALITSKMRLPGTANLFLRRFSVDEYHRMIETGVFARADGFELLDGWIVSKMPHNPPHDLAVSLGLCQVGARLSTDWFCRVQSAITLATSEPEPDLAVVQGPERRYASRHPTPADIGVLIEMSDSSLADDRQEKGALYAQANIPQYWIVNLVDRHVEVYTDPTGPIHAPEYRQRRDYGPGDSVPLVVGGQTLASIPVAELLP